MSVNTPVPSARGWLHRDDRQALLLCMLVGAAFLFGMGTIFRASPAATSRTAVSKQADDDLSTGSIVFVPVVGERCQSRLIDNATWRIRDNGTVDCRTALSNTASGPRLRWSTARVDVIRDGFTRR